MAYHWVYQLFDHASSAVATPTAHADHGTTDMARYTGKLTDAGDLLSQLLHFHSTAIFQK